MANILSVQTSQLFHFAFELIEGVEAHQYFRAALVALLICRSGTFDH